jgi:cytochrome P450 family 2 subfamily C
LVKVIQHQESLNINNPQEFINSFLIEMKQEEYNPKIEFAYENLILTASDMFAAGTETSTTLR